MKEDPSSLDPRVAQTVRDLTLMRQLYEGLMRPTLDEAIAPALASSVEISDDLCTYTFHLKEAFWSNGDHITAHDFVYSWSQVLDPKFATVYAYMLYPIKNARLVRAGLSLPETLGILARDDRTLVVQLEKPTPYFLELTAFPTYYPIHAREHAKGGDSLINSGPFMLKNWQPGSQMHLARNPSYWDADHVYLDGINLTFIDDNNTESYLFDKGKLNWLGQPISNNISTELITKLKESGKLQSYMIDGTFWLKMNVLEKPFDSPLIRQAFALATNREEIITHVLQGNQSIATSVTPPSMGMLDAPLFKDGDIAKARELFEQAGGSKNFPSITFSYSSSERTMKIAQILQQQWQDAFDIHIELKAMEAQVYRAQTRAGNFQIGTGEWIADFHDPLAFLEIFCHTDGVNDTGWSNPSYNELVDASLTITEEQKRLEILKSAEALLIKHMPIIPLYHYAFDYVCDKSVTDVLLSPLGTTDFKSAKMR